MNDSKISVRYAKALFESAADNKVLDVVRKDMEKLQEIIVIPEFQYLIVTPVMKESQKCAVLDKIFRDSIHPLSLSFLNLVFKNGREQFIAAIARNFVDLYKKDKGIKSAILTTAAPIPETVKARMEKIIQDTLNATIELKSEINSDLIGGFVIRIEDQQYDASVSNSLKRVKKQLLN